MKLIETSEGMINSDLIASVHEDPDDWECSKIRLREGINGKSVVYSQRSQDKIAELTSPIIPATPGFFVLDNYSQFDPVRKLPIVGWRTDHYGYAAPVTPQLIYEFQDGEGGGNGVYILTPEGRVFKPWALDNWETEAEWRDAMAQRRNAAEAKSAPEEKPKPTESQTVPSSQKCAEQTPA